MQINLDLKKFKTVTDLSLVEYVILAILYETENLDNLNDDEINIAFKLEEKGYLRIINDIPVLDAKGVILFENENNRKAKEVLEYMNTLKSSLGISNRPFSYKAHSRELIARINEGVDSDSIKKMLEYKYNQWKGTEWQQYLRPSTLFNKTKFYNYLEQYEQSNNKIDVDSRYAMV